MNASSMQKPEASFNHVIAFDVAKESLSVHILPSRESLSLANSATAVRRLLKREKDRNAQLGLGAMLILCEATGGYEKTVLDGAKALGLDCHRAHGSSVKAYARFRGQHAKSDAIDAALIADYGRQKPGLRLYQPPRPEDSALRELIGRRAEVKQMIGAELSRLEHASLNAVRKSLKSHLRALEAQRQAIEKEIETLASQDEKLNKRTALMQTLAGIGPVTAYTILAYMPEIGHIPGGAAASLAGLAPFDRDSGKERGRRRILAGRGQIRTCLYMAATAAIRSNTIFKDFAERLIQRGKPFKVAVTAVMRKLIVILSAMLKANEPWKHAKSACKQTQ
jgi:transposase